MHACRFVVVGEESRANMRMAEVLKRVHGRESVRRLLGLAELPSQLVGVDDPVVVCLDIFSFEPRQVVETVGLIRDTLPRVVFNLYVDETEYRDRMEEFPAEWQSRLAHYFKTFKENGELDEPIVRASLRPSVREAIHNHTHEPVRLTPVFERGLPAACRADGASGGATTFVSYSRADWQGFVSPLVSDLAAHSHRVWVDQEFLEGGDDWMDAIGEALDVCVSLLLVLSPDSVASRYVKMEYRHFVRQQKPVVPVLCRPVERIPFELAALQYIDFTAGIRADSVSRLAARLSQPSSGPGRASAR